MTDLATMERALNIIAIALAVQTTLLIGAGVAAYVAYRRASAALGGQLGDLRATVEALSVTITRAAAIVAHGAEVVTSAVDDARHSVRTAAAWMGTAVEAVASPRRTAAMGLLRGVLWWKNRRQAGRSPLVDRPV